MYTTCSELGIYMYWTRNSMNNLLSNWELVDARISASEKDLPVLHPNNVEMEKNQSKNNWYCLVSCKLDFFLFKTAAIRKS